MNVRASLALATAVLATALQPIAAHAAPADARQLTIATRQFDALSAGEFDGRLNLRIAPDGIIGGTFTDSEGSISNVYGGLTGTDVWLDLTRAARPYKHRFSGTLVNGKLTASAPHGNQVWQLEGTAAAQ